jgi:hypothetical protein
MDRSGCDGEREGEGGAGNEESALDPVAIFVSTIHSPGERLAHLFAGPDQGIEVKISSQEVTERPTPFGALPEWRVF